MNSNHEISNFLRKEKLVGNPDFHHNVLNFLFNDLNVVGLDILDVGSGNGKYSFTMCLKGAQSVTCLEPEIEGSSAGVVNKCIEVANRNSINNLKILTETLEDYSLKCNKKFDVIILINSINHLDEEHVEKIHCNKNSFMIYLKILKSLKNIIKKEGTLLLSDCPRDNFFNSLNIENPLFRSIEWQKHQSPKVWKRMLEISGFSEVKYDFMMPFPLTSNETMAYLFGSPFKIQCSNKSL